MNVSTKEQCFMDFWTMLPLQGREERSWEKFNTTEE